MPKLKLHTVKLSRTLRFTRRGWMIAGLLTFALASVSLILLRAYSAVQANGRIYSFADVPERSVAIVFGAEVYHNGEPSPMLADRIQAGAKLYQAGKVKALLLTGDNSITTYNEPEAMRRYAFTLGVPNSAIVLDYAGFRTYDSCYRARDIFKVNKAILVSQQFHLDRALLICNQLGIDSVGVAADALRAEGYSADSLFYSQIREFPSTAKSILDLARSKKPTFLGDPLPIFP